MSADAAARAARAAATAAANRAAKLGHNTLGKDMPSSYRLAKLFFGA